MRRALAVVTLMLLSGSLLAGVVGLSVAAPVRAKRAILPPLVFQLNGKQPYTIKLHLIEGERVSCEFNASRSAVDVMLVFDGVVLWSSSFSGQQKHELTASSGGTYSLAFESTSPAVVRASVLAS